MKNFILTITLIGAVAIDCQNVYSQTSYSRVVTNDSPALYWNFDEPSGNANEIVPVVPPTNADDLIPQDGASRVSYSDLGDGLNLGNAATFTLGTFGTCFTTHQLAGTTNAPGPWMLEFW